MTDDPYREWLRTRLGQELGWHEAEEAIQGAVQRRGWSAMRTLGPRDVVAVLQDVYIQMRETVGDTRADGWLQSATVDLAEYAQSVPVPAQSGLDSQATELLPTPAPLRWGRRANDLLLLLARAQAEVAGRNLEAIQADSQLQSLSETAEWDVQAARAEVRRWETEEVLGSLRADHSRIEVADAVATTAAHAEMLRLSLRELQTDSEAGQKVSAQLAHTRLSLTQLEAFLEVFPPLIDLRDAESPLDTPETRLDQNHYLLDIPLDLAVLRARHDLKVAQRRAESVVSAAAVTAGGTRAAAVDAVVRAQRQLEQAEFEARGQLEATLNSARACQAQLVPLLRQVALLEERLKVLGQVGGDPLSLARVRLEWRQGRQAARIQAHLLERFMKLLGALVEGV